MQEILMRQILSSMSPVRLQEILSARQYTTIPFPYQVVGSDLETKISLYVKIIEMGNK